MGNHGAVSAVDRPRALLCWPFQHGARLSSLVLAFPAWCSGWVDLVRSLRLQIRSERRLLVFAPSVGVGESLRQLAALAAHALCDVGLRARVKGEGGKRGKWCRLVYLLPQKSACRHTRTSCSATQSLDTAATAHRVTGFYLSFYRRIRHIVNYISVPSARPRRGPLAVRASAASTLPRCQTGLVHCIMVNSAAVPDGDAGAHQRQS